MEKLSYVELFRRSMCRVISSCALGISSLEQTHLDLPRNQLINRADTARGGPIRGKCGLTATRGTFELVLFRKADACLRPRQIC
jgi:hypothetical protein